jgi:hypothetical protein
MMPERLQTPFSKGILVHDQDKNTNLEYEVFRGIGEPNSAFVAGHHGQEYRVIGRLRTALNQRIITGDLRHSHIRVFYAHPGAIQARTREANGVDINREFPAGEMPTYPQAMLLRRVIDKFPIKYLFSFHEDYVDEPHPFYMYDDTQNTHDLVMEQRVQRLWNVLNGTLKQQGFETYTGLDDLGNQIINGYVRTTTSDHYDRTLESYLVDLGRRGIGQVQRSFTFEVPGHESIAVKQTYLKHILGEFVIPIISETLPIT